MSQFDQQMFWGNAGAGILVLCQPTGRFLLMHRSPYVNEPNTWGILGGAIDRGEKPRDAALRELREEAGYDGQVEVSGQPIYTYVSPNRTFRFDNFLGIVDEEFQPNLDWESIGYIWTTLDELPEPLHPGVRILFGDALALSYLRERSQQAAKRHGRFLG